MQTHVRSRQSVLPGLRAIALAGWFATLGPAMAPGMAPGMAVAGPQDLGATLDRVRVVISTTSDWTSLEFTGAVSIFSATSTATQGTPWHGWDTTSVHMNQPLEDGENGVTVEAQFDLLLESGPDVPDFLVLSSTKGSLGVTSISIYNLNGDRPRRAIVTRNETTSGHPNEMPFFVASAELLAGDFASAVDRPPIEPLILAFYYPWYRLEDWDSPVLRDRPVVRYYSGDLSAMMRHVQSALAGGIDGFISSWWGPGSETDDHLGKLLDVAGTVGFKVSIYFETLTGDGPLPRQQILRWFRYFFRTYGDDERFLRFEGRPAVFVWAAGTVPARVWSEIFQSLRAEGHDAMYIANALEPAYLDAFDGLHDYGPAFVRDLDAHFGPPSRACRTYGWLEGTPALRIWAATLQPGYDDRNIPGREGALIQRSDGRTYERTFRAALRSDPDWILITSFNEWWEHTHIEASEMHGDLYLELTAGFAAEFTGFSPSGRALPPLSLTAPRISDADGTVRLSWEPPLGPAPDAYAVYRSDRPFASVAGLTPLATDVSTPGHADLPPSDGTHYYAVTSVVGNEESAASAVIDVISSREKSRADPTREIPVDIALYTESTSWVSVAAARGQATQLIQQLRDVVSDIRIVGARELPDWIVSHTRNGQPDIIITFGDFPDSIYPSGNTEPDRSLAETYLDDGNFFLNTADYMFYGSGRNGEQGLITMMDVPTTMWGDGTRMTVTDAGAQYSPSLRSFATDRPFHVDELEGTDWEVEVSFADDGAGRADPVIVRHRTTGGRIGIAYQTGGDGLPRARIIGEIIRNWGSIFLFGPPPPMRRGDADADGKVDINDVLYSLPRLFAHAELPECLDTWDVNDDGVVDISDPLALLLYLFSDGVVPAPGAEACGADPTPDRLLRCEYPASLCERAAE